MKLPNVQLALVEPEKIADYILNPAHPDNGGKATFFLGLGFRRNECGPLAAAFRKVAESHPVAKSMASPHGKKYIVDGRIETPGGKKPLVRTVWIVDLGLDKPRLVTAYPQEE
jgi:hypothetical protein